MIGHGRQDRQPPWSYSPRSNSSKAHVPGQDQDSASSVLAQFMLEPRSITPTSRNRRHGASATCYYTSNLCKQSSSPRRLTAACRWIVSCPIRLLLSASRSSSFVYLGLLSHTMAMTYSKHVELGKMEHAAMPSKLHMNRTDVSVVGIAAI